MLFTCALVVAHFAYADTSALPCEIDNSLSMSGDGFEDEASALCLLQKRSQPIHSRTNHDLESSLKQVFEVVQEFKKMFVDAFTAIPTLMGASKSESIKDTQTKVANVLKAMHVDAEKVVQHFGEAIKIFNGDVGKALPDQFAAEFKGHLDRATVSVTEFAAFAFHAEKVLEDTDLTNLCNLGQPGAKEIEEKASDVIGGVDGLKVEALKDNFKEFIVEVADEDVDKLVKRINLSLNRVIELLPKAVHMYEGMLVGVFKDKCPNFAELATSLLGFVL